jgi:subtilisin family serine protease
LPSSSSDPNVEYAEPNYIYHTSATPNDSYFNQQWAHQNLQSEQAWDIETGQSNVVIAIVDSGVDWNHPDLAANIWDNTGEVIDGIDNDGNGYVDDVRGYDFVDTTMATYPGEDGTLRDNDPMDFHGHGTHCAGIAAAVTDNSLGVAGMSWNCSIMPVRAGYMTPTGGGTLESDDSAMAITYAADNNATIISMSWGGYGISSIIKDAIDYAYGRGIVLFAAAGNGNTYHKHYPATYNNVIAVAATDSADTKASFSNFSSWIDIAAPGVNVLSTLFDDNYASWSGTSMATPYAAGLAGLLLSKNPSFSNAEVLNILRSTCDPVISSEYIGLGRINAYKAFQRNSILSVNIDSSLEDANIVETLAIRGTAQGSNFEKYVVEVGSGAYPASWTKITESTSPVENGVLAE